MYRSILLALSLLFIITTTKAAVFVVTSNADSGPGTLREALTLAAANGSAEKDFINFNLPDVSEAGRTITIVSSLPGISSNLTIDGTTQPGIKFGISNTKIIIQPSNTNDKYDPFLLTDVNGFEMYGLYIRDFIGVFPFEGSAVLYVHSCKNIQIGAPGKGNVFSNNAYVLASIYGHYYGNVIPPIFDGIENLTVYSNFFGFEPDGKSFRNMAYGYNATLDLSGCAGTIQIGGDNDNQRNYFGNAAMPIECKGTSPQTSHPTTFIIKNNFFNYNSDGLPAPLPYFNGDNLYTIRISDNEPYTSPLILPYTVYIQNNKIQAPCGLQVGITTGDIVCQGNQVNNEESLNNASFASGGISFQSEKRVIIGGENPGEANTLYNTGIYAASPLSVLLQRNSDYCINNGYNIVWQTTDEIKPKLPTVAINNITNSSVSGTATPLSKVELFWDDDCQHCLPLTYIATIMAGADGNWAYNGNVQKGVIASATINGYTSIFTTGTAISGGKVIHSTCGKNDGSISGISFQYTGNYTWKNEQGQIIKQTPDIKDLSPGKYTLTAGNGTCSSDYTFEIFDATPQIVADQIHIVNPSCGENTGSITYLSLSAANYNVLQNDYGAYQYKWLDASNKIRSTSLDLTSVEAGTYRLEVTYNNSCLATYGPVTLKNTIGPSIDDSKPAITNTTCGQSTGSIKNIIISGGSGTRHFTWKNNQQQEIAYTQDLTGQPAGKYTLQVTDDTQCGPVYSKEIEIAEVNGITLTESTLPIAPASCGKANGAVNGIAETGGTKYEWRDANGKLVGNQIDLTGVPGGAYQLTVSNAFCQKQSKVYQVAEQSATAFPSTYTVNHIDACYGEANGALQVNEDILIKAARWVDATGTNVGMHNGVTGLAAGSYKLYLTDQNGCESYYNTYQVAQLPEYIVADQGQINQETCGQKNGSVSNVTVTGGLPPYTYKWLDAKGTQIGSANSITALAAGNYTLNVIDSRCGDVDIQYTIQNITQDLPAPSVSDLQICSPGEALFFVNNPVSNMVYRLYDQENSTTPLSEETGGRFKLSVTGNRSFYVSETIGTCESSRSEVKFSVGLSTVNIANSFSPNGDGYNDYWKINGIESYPQALVQVFNRSGQKLFESKGYTRQFNGTYNGKPLPYGTYFYIINLNKNCNLLSGSLTIIR